MKFIEAIMTQTDPKGNDRLRIDLLELKEGSWLIREQIKDGQVQNREKRIKATELRAIESFLALVGAAACRGFKVEWLTQSGINQEKAREEIMRLYSRKDFA